MKMNRIVVAVTVALVALCGLAWALTWRQPTTAKADANAPGGWEGNWYFKDGGWIDYAPNGVPDFDQKQDAWGTGPSFPDPNWQWTYCGPVAAANSIWWFDSKFEPFPVGSPGPPPSTLPYNDNYYLVTPYGGPPPPFDDHDPQNVGGMGGFGLVDDLACYFDTDGMNTGGGHQGTNVHDMAVGLQHYLYNDPTHTCSIPGRSNGGSYYDDYHVQLVKMPTWEWVVEEVERSEDVVLLLGFWTDYNFPSGPPEWKRLGGHFVTAAGINATDLQIAFSDPYHDNREQGGAGRVLSGTLAAHQHPGVLPDSTHNDAGNVSHDYYSITTTVTSPAGLWEILGYPFAPGVDFKLQNCPTEFKAAQVEVPGAGPVFVEVEYALAMSPFHWKPGGEWVDTYWHEQWITEWWWYEDDGDSCLPDFWWGDDEAFYDDGPAALANSLWWFDSKAETLLTGGWPEPPPDKVDHYDLVTTYDWQIPDEEWDDHAITNTMPFIRDLSDNYLNTTPAGTTRQDMAAGIDAYLSAKGVAGDFYTKTHESPTWEWIADEVETCEDVIMLLGFYEYMGGDIWERKGGHWVNAAGVNRQDYFVGLSDPALDNANHKSISHTLYLGRVFPPEHLGTAFTDDEKQDPQAISHDIYRVVTSTLPQGQLALHDYPVSAIITGFVDVNEPGFLHTGNPLTTVVEWAIGVSPYSELVITKTGAVSEVVAGDRVTYTLEYANWGLAAAQNVTITDMLDLSTLTAISYTAYPPIHATPGITYVWTLPKLTYSQTGVITITGESLVTGVLSNTATITGLTTIGGPTPDKNPGNNTSRWPPPRLVFLPLVLRNY